MRALAEFIMRGRAQAALVAVLGSLAPFFPLLSASAVALVSLRRGGVDAAYLMAWAMLIPTVTALVGPEALPVAFYMLCILATVVGAAVILRNENSWPLGLLGLVALSAAGGLIHGWTFPEPTQAWAAEMEAWYQALEEGGTGISGRPPITASWISGMLAASIAMQAIFALVIGRSWQAMLYNPGGFRAEFYELRLNKNPALLYFAVTALTFGAASSSGAPWWLLSGLPLVLVTTAIVHNRVRARGMGVGWLVVYYFLMMLPSFYLVAACVGLSDSWINYRQRLGPKTPKESPDPDDE